VYQSLYTPNIQDVRFVRPIGYVERCLKIGLAIGLLSMLDSMLSVAFQFLSCLVKTFPPIALSLLYFFPLRQKNLLYLSMFYVLKSIPCLLLT